MAFDFDRAPGHRNRINGDDYEPVTTLGSLAILPAIPPTEMSAFGEFFHNPPMIVKNGHTVVNDDAGIPRLFADIRDALKWCRSEGTELIRSEGS